MAYQELSKLYYQDVKLYESALERRLHSMNAVKLSFPMGEKTAFFVTSPEVSNLSMDILRLDKQVALVRNRLPPIALRQFTKRCLIDEIVVTNRIEGVHSTRREISVILDELESQVSKGKRARRFDGLVAKYFLLQSNAEIPMKSCEDIRALYDELVLSEVISEDADNKPDGQLFRKESACIISATGKEVHRGVSPESRIIKLLDSALDFLWSNQCDSLYRLSIFHYLFEYIHPFYDGNGRTGRFILSYLLSKELDHLLPYRLSVTIAENINSYYKAFETCNNPRNAGDLTPFLIMMLEMIQKSTAQLLEALQNRELRLNKYFELISALPGSKKSRTCHIYEILIQAGLFSEYGVSSAEIASFAECSLSSVTTDLRVIANADLLRKQSNSRTKYYEINLDTLDRILKNE